MRRVEARSGSPILTAAMAPSLDALLASVADADACYMAWNARSPGWGAGPECSIAAGRLCATRAADVRTQLPLLAEVPMHWPAAPLAGLAAFRNAVMAEKRFVERAAVDTPSNVSHLVAFWDEVGYAFATAGPVIALNVHRPLDAPSTTRISIVARNGHHWIRLCPIKPETLRDEFREADALVHAPSWPATDDAVTQCSIVRIARDMCNASSGESIELVLTRLTAPGSAPAAAAPPPTDATYWSAPEATRIAWRLQAVVATVEALGVHVRFGTRMAPAPLPRPAPPPPLAVTRMINLDVSALVAITSEITHALPSLRDDIVAHPNRALLEQCEAERKSELLHLLARECSGPTTLVATRETIVKFCGIVNVVGSARERERAERLFTSRDAFWDMSRRCAETAQLRHTLQLPVRGVDSLADLPKCESDGKIHAVALTYAHDVVTSFYAAQMRTALQSLAARAPKPKSLSASAHTLHALSFGAAAHITTLTAHAHSVQELCETTGAQLDNVPAHGTTSTAALWLIRPRSLVGEHARMIETQPGVAHEAPGLLPTEHSRTALAGDAAEDLPTKWDTDSSDTSIHSADGLQGTAPVPSIAERVWCWMAGPAVPEQLVIRHYPWWPWEPVEAWWRRLTAPVAWKPLPALSLPADDEAGEVYEMTAQSPQPSHRGDTLTRGSRWLAAIHRDVRHNAWHWALLAAVFIAWLLAFSVLVDDAWFQARVMTDHGWASPEYFSCTSTYWGRNAECGLDGASCQPFSNTTVPFRCPRACDDTTLLNPRTVGDAAYNYVPLVVGGADRTPYRGDSFACAAAQHAGVLSRNGGCGVLRLVGTYANYTGSTQHGIQSAPFASEFPLSFTFDSLRGERHCGDTRWRMYVLNVVFSAVVTIVLRPKMIVLFWMLACVGFWHVNLVSELRDFPPPVGEAAGDFGAHLLACYAIWRISIRFVWPSFTHVPLEFGMSNLGLWWIGTLLDVVFADVPLQRLEGHDIAQQPGALASLIVVILVVFVLGVNQVRVIRATGNLPKYLALYVIAGIIIALCAAVPREGVRLHHYIIGLALLPACGFPTRISMMCCALLFGMYINGVARWGFDGLIQDVSVIQGDAVGDSALPSFALHTSLDDGLVRWNPIPRNERSIWSAFMLMIDDVPRYQGPATSYNLTKLLTQTASETSQVLGPDQIHQALLHSVHYVRLAYTSSSQIGDFTKAALASLNGTWVPPPPGRT